MRHDLCPFCGRAVAYILEPVYDEHFEWLEYIGWECYTCGNWDIDDYWYPKPYIIKPLQQEGL